ncbi:MAG: type II toxin-antitoxin system PemK/MazF family toxin [Oscillospiraceae bacterium]|nr:type II toxin-antitoxin system PemK/MazF family toxin [Oscillospiraceae bacterium]
MNQAGTSHRRSVKETVDTNVKRGEIYYADLSPVVGSEQGGIRPVLIVQNDTGNRHSPTVIAAAITSQLGKAKLPTHISLKAQSYGLPKESVVLLEQIRTLDKRRLRERMGQVDGAVMEKVDAAIAVSFGLRPPTLI